MCRVEEKSSRPRRQRYRRKEKSGEELEGISRMLVKHTCVVVTLVGFSHAPNSKMVRHTRRHKAGGEDVTSSGSLERGANLDFVTHPPRSLLFLCICFYYLFGVFFLILSPLFIGMGWDNIWWLACAVSYMIKR